MKIEKVRFEAEVLSVKEKTFFDKEAQKNVTVRYANINQENSDDNIQLKLTQGEDFEKGQTYEFLVDIKISNFNGRQYVTFTNIKE